VRDAEGMKKLRELRSEVHGLRYAVSKVRDGEASLDPYTSFLQNTVTDINDLLEQLTGDDALRDIVNAWELMKTCSVLQAAPARDTADKDANATPTTPTDGTAAVSANGTGESTSTTPAANTNVAATSATSDPQRLGQELKLLDEQSCKIIAKAGYLTIPARLTDWLKMLQAGDAVPFHALFKDEVLDQQDRQDILDLLALVPDSFILNQVPVDAPDEQPKSNLGVYIDAASGMVHCYDRDEANRFTSLKLIGGVWLAITALILIANIMMLVRLPTLAQVASFTQYLPIVALSSYARMAQEATTTSFPSLFSAANWPVVLGWLGVSAGLIVHVMVTMRKRFHTPNATFPSRKRLSVIVASKESQVLTQVVIAAFGFIVFVLTFGLPQPTGDSAAVTREVSRFLFSAFLVGYSLDSFVELFVSNFDQRAAALNADLTKRTGATA
jgi:hypothetical protein